MRRQSRVVLLVSVIVLTIILGVSRCAPFATPPPEIEEGFLILSHSTYVDRHGYFHLVGEVQNIDERNAEDNRILVSFFDENGVVYATGAGPCYRQIMAPNEKSPFQIVFLRAPQGDNYRLTADWQATDIEPKEEVTFRDVSASMDVEGQYVVTGEIVNEGSEAIDYAMIICTFYDASGNVVAVDLSFADASPIPAGSSSTFVLVADPSVSPNIDDFSLQSEVQ